MAKTYGFTVGSLAHKLFIPREDFYSASQDGSIAVVADGVTRDPCDWLPDTSMFLGKLKFAWKYPRLSPAAEAAKIVCRVVPEVLLDYREKDEKAIENALEMANRRIVSWNMLHFPEPDYATRNKAGCVAAVSATGRDYIHYGYLSDCGVTVVDESGKLVFKTPDIGPARYDRERWQTKSLKGREWRDPEARKIVRRDFVNKKDSPYAYGVLNGDQDATKYFVSKGRIERKGGEIVLTYTDGVEPSLFTGDLFLTTHAQEAIASRQIQKLKKLCKKNVRSEGTLVLTNI